VTARKFSPTFVQAEACRLSLRRFAKECWPNVDTAQLVWSWHLDALCDHLSYVSMREIRFLWINMPPRTTKSVVTSVIFPVWEWLQDPKIQFMTGSYVMSLGQRDAGKSRDLIDSKWFQARWGHKFRFSADEKTKRQYRNDKGGRRVVVATDAGTTGEGGNQIIIDDPHNATDAESEATRKGTHKWWDHAVVNRLNQPDKDSWILNGQRTGEDDLFGHIDKNHDTSEIVKLILPNEFDSKRRCITSLPSGKVIFKDPRKTDGELLCPARMGPESTQRMKRSMKDKYKLQYQQDSKGGGGKILRAEAWKKWEGEIPECELILSVYDTAFDEGETNDYSARIDFGIFNHAERILTSKGEDSAMGKVRRCLILLGAWRAKIPYNELRREALAHYRKIKPDWLLVEKKATGIILCQDLAKANVHGLRRVSLAHGKAKLDKVERAHISSAVLDEGLVYYPERQWAEKVRDECSAFPEGSNDDWVDCLLMGMQFLRRMQEVGQWEEEKGDEVRLFKRIRPLYG
jgi:predicted phage terminase large subunit-like protein